MSLAKSAANSPPWPSKMHHNEMPVDSLMFSSITNLKEIMKGLGKFASKRLCSRRRCEGAEATGAPNCGQILRVTRVQGCESTKSFPILWLFRALPSALLTPQAFNHDKSCASEWVSWSSILLTNTSREWHSCGNTRLRDGWLEGYFPINSCTADVFLRSSSEK